MIENNSEATHDKQLVVLFLQSGAIKPLQKKKVQLKDPQFMCFMYFMIYSLIVF